MPIKWNAFSGKDRKRNRTHTVQTEPVSTENVRSIVNDEISNVATRNQIISYFENTEAVLSEIKSATEQGNEEVMRLEAAIHKDNLLCYKNIKNALDQIENNNRLRASKLRHGIITSVVIGILIIAALGFIIVKMYI